MKILLTGARSMATLDLARHLASGGHTIYAADTDRAPVCRFSKAVSKYFRIPSPRFKTETFNARLVQIAEDEEIDLLIPNWEETVYISKILDHFPSSCVVFCSPFETVHRLHNKFHFINLLEELGVKTPKTQLIRSTEELDELIFANPYALKACYSRGSEALHKVQPWDRPPSITIHKENPWVAQEWIEGKRLCTYTVCKEGEVLAHTTYPVKLAANGKFAVTFESIDHPETLSWTEKLVASEGYTGQIAFDFIETESKELYAIECNPRITSGVHLFRPADHLHKAFTTEIDRIIHPKPKTKQQILPGMLMYGWRGINSIKDFATYLKKLLSVSDTLFRIGDPLPGILSPLLLGGQWLGSKRKGVSIITYYSHDVEWSSETPADWEGAPRLTVGETP